MRDSGFSLIEVLVALVILSVVLLAAHRAMTHILSLATDLITRHVAVWVASDAYEHLRLLHQVPQHDWVEPCTNAGYHFECVFHVGRLPDPSFMTVDLSVNALVPKGYRLLHETFILATT